MARKIFLRLHRWIGLSFGIILMCNALLGTMLTIARPLDQTLNPQLFQAHAPHTASPSMLDDAQHYLVTQFGNTANLTYRPPRTADDTLWVRVSGPWDGTVYLEPSSGQELGRRASDEGFVNVLFELHSALLLGDTGKNILALTALSYLFLLCVGVWLWWPKNWRHAWTIKINSSSSTRALFDLHRVGGVVLGGLILVSVVSGAYMAYKPLGQALNFLSGSSTIQSMTIAKADNRKALSLDELALRAQQEYPDGMLGYIQTNALINKPVVIRVKLPDDPHPNGRSSITLNPYTGETLAKTRWNQADTATQATAIMYPLHIGQIGGTWHTVLIALLGLTLTGLGLSGLLLWWRRK